MSSTLESIRHLSETLFQYTNVDDMVRQVLHTALETIGEDAGSILLADAKTKQLIFRYVVGESAEQLCGTSIPWDEGIAGAVFSSGNPEIIPAVQQDPRHFSATDRLTGYQSRDMIVVPLMRHGGAPIGVMEVLNKATGQINRDDLDILVVIASIAAAAIEQTDNAEAIRLKDIQLQQSQKMEAMGRLAGGVAHDFNNLLTVMQGFSEMIVSSLDPSAVGRMYAEEILKAAQRASGLTKQLLAFSRKQVLEPRVVNLNELVSNLEKMLKRLIGEDVNLLTKLDPNLGWIKADPGQIEQVLMNLSVNARDAMLGEGSLTIETGNVELDDLYASQSADLQPGRYVCLSVNDTGSGMDETTLAKLFEPFFTTKAPGKGTGLGLSIVYGIVKQSRGHVAVSSAVGCGTTFKIYLPQVEVPDPGVVVTELGSTCVQGSETILVVDDEEQVRSLECGVLQASGYRVLPVGNGEEALRICRESSEPIHLLVTDIVMPMMNGRELARRVALHRPSMRVLFVSGYPDETEISSEGMAGKTNFLQKPFTSDTLLRRIRQSLDGMEKSSAATCTLPL
ncbi:MAG: response regulator [Nitrospiraceae bacterium]|nr:response regulator [Nitrospiraceae bacterium]